MYSAEDEDKSNQRWNDFFRGEVIVEGDGEEAAEECSTDCEPEHFYFHARRYGVDANQPFNLIRADMGVNLRPTPASQTTLGLRKGTVAHASNRAT